MADEVSEVDIINVAGALVGEKPITSLNDSSELAKQGKILLKFSRKKCFSLRVDWVFATGRSELAAHADEPIFGTYDYQFVLPSDCARVRRLQESTDDDTEYPFRRESLEDEDVILANVSTAYIVYNRIINNTGRWPGYFANLVAHELAILLCGPLRQDKRKVHQLKLLRDDALTEAKAGNGAEDVETDDNDTALDKGNTDVVDAATEEVVTKSYIQTRTSNS